MLRDEIAEALRIREDRVPIYWTNVDKREGGCWEWTSMTSSGYGRFWTGYRSVPAHRVSFMLRSGFVPVGEAQLDHLCRNRACVNPDHLQVVSARTNTLRGNGPSADNANKEFCQKGHPLFGPNLYVKPQGWRVCRTCNNASYSAQRKKRRATDQEYRDRERKRCREWYDKNRRAALHLLEPKP